MISWPVPCCVPCWIQGLSAPELTCGCTTGVKHSQSYRRWHRNQSHHHFSSVDLVKGVQDYKLLTRMSHKKLIRKRRVSLSIILCGERGAWGDVVEWYPVPIWKILPAILRNTKLTHYKNQKNVKHKCCSTWPGLKWTVQAFQIHIPLFSGSAVYKCEQWRCSLRWRWFPEAWRDSPVQASSHRHIGF